MQLAFRFAGNIIIFKLYLLFIALMYYHPKIDIMYSCF